mmetsp:Transcript_57582/g.117811  ORF Transcript_57582/g.117811 Transcript_57582/m.117811 type:complete len:220 (-) Transcript_57582:220-879(-)
MVRAPLLRPRFFLRSVVHLSKFPPLRAALRWRRDPTFVECPHPRQSLDTPHSGPLKVELQTQVLQPRSANENFGIDHGSFVQFARRNRKGVPCRLFSRRGLELFSGCAGERDFLRREFHSRLAFASSFRWLVRSVNLLRTYSVHKHRGTLVQVWTRHLDCFVRVQLASTGGTVRHHRRRGTQAFQAHLCDLPPWHYEGERRPCVEASLRSESTCSVWYT